MSLDQQIQFQLFQIEVRLLLNLLAQLLDISNLILNTLLLVLIYSQISVSFYELDHALNIWNVDWNPL